MKVLHINNYHFPRGGSDRYFLDVARGLAERGYEVRTLAPVDARDTDTDLRVNASLRPLSTSSRPGPMDLGRFFYSREAQDVVRRVIEDFAPDIVHLHIYYGQMSASILRPIREAGIPIVQTLHEYKIVCPAQTMLRDQRICTACRGGRYWQAVRYKCNRGSRPRSALSAAELVVSEWLGARRHIERFLAVSDFQKRLLLSMGLDAKKVSRLYNFTENVASPSKNPGDYFLYVGRITSGKGLETLFKAYKIYQDRCTSDAIPLYIVGEGDKQAELYNLAKEIGISDSVDWLGYRTGEALATAYSNCRALINPSELNETFGLNNLEAMAHGRPVICANSGAFSEVVRDGRDGFIIKAGDVTGFADRMYALSPDRSLDMGKQALERVAHTFSKGAHLSELGKVYAEISGDKNCHITLP